MAGVDEFFERVAALRREGAAFAIATVVSRRAPVSSHMGDRAIVFGDGVMEGFVGGSCSREVVRRQALEALATGEPRLVSIRPDDEPAAGGDGVVVPMTCGSKGSVDVYIEPFVQARTVAVVGLTPVADALVRLAKTLEYRVIRAVTQEELRDVDDAVSLEELGARLAEMPAGARASLGVVVASQGHYDEPALEAAVRARSPYIALVASRRRGTEVREALVAAGLAAEDVAAIHNPAGLDLGARHPGEVALSILAELVRSHPSPRAFATDGVVMVAQDPVAPAIATDPICGMEVVVTPDAVAAVVDGETVYFCCDGCRSRYLAQVGA
jgi:xanthine dehydrogenase accessory factor